MTSRGQVSEETLNHTADLLMEKLYQRLDEKGYSAFASRHEILGILKEEFEEYTDAVHEGTEEERIAELLDLGVAALFGAASIISGKVDW